MRVCDDSEKTGEQSSSSPGCAPDLKHKRGKHDDGDDPCHATGWLRLTVICKGCRRHSPCNFPEYRREGGRRRGMDVSLRLRRQLSLPHYTHHRRSLRFV